MVISSHANPHLKIFADSKQCLALTSFEYNEPRVHLLGSWFQLCYCNHLCVSFSFDFTPLANLLNDLDYCRKSKNNCGNDFIKPSHECIHSVNGLV